MYLCNNIITEIVEVKEKIRYIYYVSQEIIFDLSK